MVRWRPPGVAGPRSLATTAWGTKPRAQQPCGARRGSMIRRSRGIRWHGGLALATLLALAIGLLSLSGDGAAAEPAPGRFSQVSAGGLHSCALRVRRRSSICWGWIRQAGLAEAPAGRFSQVSAGCDAHTCALRTDGGLACWGYNGDRQTEAPAGHFSQVSAGLRHGCALHADRSLVCWGHANYGATEAPAGRFSQITAGHEHSCALRGDAGLVCWGSNENGLGQSVGADGPASSRSARVAVHTCAVRVGRRCGLLGIPQSRVGRSQRQRRAVSAHRTDRAGAASRRADRVRLPAEGGAWIWPALRLFLANAGVARWPISAERGVR